MTITIPPGLVFIKNRRTGVFVIYRRRSDGSLKRLRLRR